MPSKKKRNNKPKSANTIYHSSLTIQPRKKDYQRARFSRAQNSSIMEEDHSLNAKVDEAKEAVDVESIKTLEIVDDDHNNNGHDQPETKRDISILEDIIDKAEKILDGSDDSSSSDDEKEALVVCENNISQPEEEEEEEEEEDKEDKVESSLVENNPSVDEDNLVPTTVETESKSSPENEEEAVSSSPPIVISDQKVEESIGEGSKVVVVDEAPKYENVLDSSDNQTITPNIPTAVPAVTSGSLEADSWKSCCGLFDLLRLRRSER